MGNKLKSNVTLPAIILEHFNYHAYVCHNIAVPPFWLADGRTNL